MVGPLKVSEKFMVVGGWVGGGWSSDNTVSKVQVLRCKTLDERLWTFGLDFGLDLDLDFRLTIIFYFSLI